MSRIGNIPVPIPDGIEVKIDGSKLTATKGKNSLSHVISDGISARVENNEVIVENVSNTRQSNALHGLNRSLINNIIVGLNEGYKKKLEISGVGYRAQLQGKTLVLNLGYSHPVEMEAPEGITFEVPSNTEIIVSGIDKQLVGETAAKIRGFRVPDVYKGKGVKYEGEVIHLREGKTGAGL